MTTFRRLQAQTMALVLMAGFGAVHSVQAADAAPGDATQQLAAAESARAQSAKYSQIAAQSRTMATSKAKVSDAATTTLGATASRRPPTVQGSAKPAVSRGATPAFVGPVLPAASDGSAATALEYEKIAALADRLAADAQRVSDFHAKVATALQRQAEATAKLRR